MRLAPDLIVLKIVEKIMFPWKRFLGFFRVLGTHTCRDVRKCYFTFGRPVVWSWERTRLVMRKPEVPVRFSRACALLWFAPLWLVLGLTSRIHTYFYMVFVGFGTNFDDFWWLGEEFFS